MRRHSGRRRTLSRQVASVTCLAVVLAVTLAGLVALGLVRHAYDGQARAVLHREAVLVAGLAERPATVNAARPGRPAGRLLTGSGVSLVRVHADGRRVGRAAVDAADIHAAAAGQSLRDTRTVGGRRYFVDVEPVADDGGVVVTQTTSAARAPEQGVLRKLGLALLIGLLVALVLGVLLAHRLARPLVAAAGAAHRLAAGERDLRVVPDGPAEVAEVAESLNSLARSLAGSEGRQREFLLSVSHELRTPLTAIRGFAEALADGVAVGPDAERAGATIGAEAARLQRLVCDLLDLARLGADSFRLDLADLDLADLVASAATVWGARCAAAGVAFSAELTGGTVPVRTDGARIRQVVDGLAENALRLTPAGRPIVFALQTGRGPGAGTAVLQVRDGGPGLRDEDLAVAFDRAVLHDRYRGVRDVGTGVGLALVAGLVGRLGGTVAAGHAPEGGAAFTVRLPLSAAPQEARTLGAAAPAVRR